MDIDQAAINYGLAFRCDIEEAYPRFVEIDSLLYDYMVDHDIEVEHEALYKMESEGVISSGEVNACLNALD